ncbi:unnamed protein product, partial [Adineta steineri]
MPKQTHSEIDQMIREARPKSDLQTLLIDLSEVFGQSPP